MSTLLRPCPDCKRIVPATDWEATLPWETYRPRRCPEHEENCKHYRPEPE